MEKINLRIKRLSDNFNDVPLPEYATSGSAGMDIRAAVQDDIIIKPKMIDLIPTNISIEIPSGYEIQVRPRSGLAVKHGITILNAPGTIDSDYRGEVKIILINLGNGDFKISRGDRIAQLIISKVYKAEIVVSTELNESARGEGGFGHSGTK